jgi:hypothetical protein
VNEIVVFIPKSYLQLLSLEKKTLTINKGKGIDLSAHHSPLVIFFLRLIQRAWKREKEKRGIG